MGEADELLTARLRLRRWRAADEAPMATINRDPEVTRFLNRPVDPSATAAFCALVADHWATHGYGLWAVESREPAHLGRFLGFVGVAHPTFIPELAERLEIGWRLARPAWGRGLATEAAVAARDHAFATLPIAELISVIHPENARSQRVAAKLGMHPRERAYNPLIRRAIEVWQMDRPDG
jgi:RimJ/RimL family protein N-acetyltransferase